MNIQIQKGLGDAIYCYPILTELAKHNGIRLETQYPELFVNQHNIIASKDPLAKIDLKLRWHVGKENCYEQLCRKAKVWPEFNYGGIFVSCKDLLDDLLKTEYSPFHAIVIKEPSCAGYHKESNETKYSAEIEPMQEYIDTKLENYLCLTVGHQEKFTKRLNIPKIHHVDLVDKLTLWQYILTVFNSKLILTQIGNLVALACAFRKPIKIFKSIGETEKQFEIRKNCVVIPKTCQLMD